MNYMYISCSDNLYKLCYHITFAFCFYSPNPYEKATLKDFISQNQIVINALGQGSPTSKSRWTCQL